MNVQLPVLLGRLLLAAALGMVIGLEREARQKAAGVRTNMLIALGSALFTIMSMDLVEGSPADRSRVASNIVTGVGFLGGGAILRTGHNIQGLTTAATIWVIAAIGMAAGAGRYALAVAATGATLLVLLGLPVLERYVEGRVRDVRPTEGGRQSSE